MFDTSGVILKWACYFLATYEMPLSKSKFYLMKYLRKILIQISAL